MRTVTLPAIELHQNGTRLLITKMRVGDLPTFTKVDPFNSTLEFSDDNQGYQRPAEMPRIKKFANWLKQESEDGAMVRMPTAILLSARGADVTLKDGTITLKQSTPLQLVDGQHRKRGFEYAIEDRGLVEFADYDAVVIMLGMDKVGEMRQFSTVNGTQKSVRTDLVNMILTQLSAREGDEAVRVKDQWRVVVSQVVKRLNEDKTGPWYDRIVMPDQRAYSEEEIADNPELRHRRVSRATSFMTALKPIETYLAVHFSTHNDLTARADKLFAVIDAYWRAVRRVNPECFEDADDYVMLKTPGIFALHLLARRVMIDMHTGMRQWTEDQFTEVLENCGALADAKYWSIGDGDEDGGDAAKYGSMKGFAELAELLYEDLHS